MAASLSELTVQVLTARLAKKEMSIEEIRNEMASISAMIKSIDDGTIKEQGETPAEARPGKINFKKVFKRDKVVCLLCNKEFTMLKRHLSIAHGLKPGEYKKQFSIPASYDLVASDYAEKRRQDALDRGLGDNLVKARAARAAKTAKTAQAPKPKAPKAGRKK
jgi:predicted transcriptional regulator